MVGKNEQALTVFSLAVISADSDDLGLITKYNRNSAAFRTDKPLYRENKRVSLFLRMAQVLLLIPSNKSEKFQEALEALERESADLGSDATEDINLSMVYMRAMSLPGLVDVVDDLSQFALTGAKHARKLDITITEIELKTIGPVTSLDGYLQLMFAFQLSRISNIETLQRIMKGLIAKTKEQREFLLKAFEADHFEKSLVIKSPWVKSVNEGETIGEGHAEAYAALGRDLAEAGETEFAMAAFVSAAVIWDEYLKKPEEAIACLEEATGLLGKTHASARALSRVLFHQGHYEGQIEVGMPLSVSFYSGSTEASFFLPRTGNG